MQKLAMSNAKALMKETDSPRRTDSSSQSMVQQFDIPNVKYNIPQEFLQESPQQSSQPYLSSLPVENTKPVGVPTVDAIKNSKLPDEIKKLMMEHPIAQPNQAPTMTMSNELIEITGAIEPSGIPYIAPVMENKGPSRGNRRPRPNSSERRRRPR